LKDEKEINLDKEKKKQANPGNIINLIKSLKLATRKTLDPSSIKKFIMNQFKNINLKKLSMKKNNNQKNKN
jgi:hypothetical protein